MELPNEVINENRRNKRAGVEPVVESERRSGQSVGRGVPRHSLFLRRRAGQHRDSNGARTQQFGAAWICLRRCVESSDRSVRGRSESGDARNGKDLLDTFDVTAVVARLQKANRWNPDALSVTLRPLTPIPPMGGEAQLRQRSEASAEKAMISYERINLLVTPE